MKDFIKINNNPHLFDGLVIKKTYEDDPTEIGGLATLNHELEGCFLYFNSAYDWKRHDKIIKKSYNQGVHPSINPKSFVYHELGHWLDLNNNPQEYKMGHFNLYAFENFYPKVSLYAQQSPYEFVSEYISARMSGIGYPKTIDKIFEQHYDGRKIPLIFPKSVD